MPQKSQLPDLETLRQQYASGNIDSDHDAAKFEIVRDAVGQPIGVSHIEVVTEGCVVSRRQIPYPLPPGKAADFDARVAHHRGNVVRAYADVTGNYPRNIQTTKSRLESRPSPLLPHHWTPQEFDAHLLEHRYPPNTLDDRRREHTRAIWQALANGRYVPPQVLSAEGAETVVEQAVNATLSSARWAQESRALKERVTRFEKTIGYWSEMPQYEEGLRNVLREALTQPRQHSFGGLETRLSQWGETELVVAFDPGRPARPIGYFGGVDQGRPAALLIGTPGGACLHRVDWKMHGARIMKDLVHQGEVPLENCWFLLPTGWAPPVQSAHVDVVASRPRERG